MNVTHPLRSEGSSDCDTYLEVREVVNVTHPLRSEGSSECN